MPQVTIDEALRLALSQHNAGRLSEAERVYRQVLAAAPNHPDALHLLGVVALQRGNLEDAQGLITRAIAAFPEAPNYHHNLGNVLALAGRRNEAIASYRRAVALRSNDENFHNSLGVALAEDGQFPAAIDSYRRALALNSASADYHSNLSNALREDGQIDAAVEAAGKACALQPRMAAAFNNLGAALLQSGRFDDAITNYRRAVELEPDFATAHYNLAVALLSTGRLEEGWAQAEWRWKAKELALPVVDFGRPRWDGASLGGKRILLYTEQGFGDVIHMVRYVPQVVARGGKVILGVPKELVRLLKCVPGVEAIVTHSEDLPVFDVQCPLLSLPAVMKTTLATIPGLSPYLRADPELVDQWRVRIAAPGDTRIKVGLVWAGRSEHKNDRNRSMALRMLAPLAGAANARFFSLQKGEAAGQLQSAPPGMDIVDCGSQINDFADLAAVLENLDLLITVDTAPAHLAGALGRPVWMVLPFIPDWRWMLERRDSPWYPTMKLFRQPQRGAWEAAIALVKDELGRIGS